MSLGPGQNSKAIDNIATSSQIVGVKKQYKLGELETAMGDYAFDSIKSDMEVARRAGKQFWIQIAYTRFSGSGNPLVPRYMWNNKEYGCGPDYYGTYARKSGGGGWLPCKWHDKFADRYIALWEALGARFGDDPILEGVSLGETAVDTSSAKAVNAGFSVSLLESNMKRIAIAVRKAFPNKIVMQMTNFAPYDLNNYVNWLVSNGIGIGGPDMKLTSSLLLDITYPLYRRYHDDVPTGPDIQFGNYEKMSVEELLDQAIDLTNPWYVFWLNREPYFTEEVLPLTSKRALPAVANMYE
jgi:hypothetical protein